MCVCVCVCVCVCSFHYAYKSTICIIGGHPLTYFAYEEGQKSPPSFRKPLGFLEVLLYGDGNDVILDRHIRETLDTTTEAQQEAEKDTWAKLTEFYADNNNMAMYLVLPLIILVYGGCSVIYCVAKCRRYMRKKHQRKLREDKVHLNSDDKNDLNQEEDTPSYESKQTFPTILSSPNLTNDVISADNRTVGTPLPSQVRFRTYLCFNTYYCSKGHWVYYLQTIVKQCL